MSLGTRAISGIKWSGVAQVVQLLTRVGTIVVLSRLLAPREFGIMSMAFVLTGFVDLFKELGTGSALIQRKNPTNRLLSTTFWTNVCFGVFAAAGVIAIAPLAADFYHNARLVPVLQLLSVSFLLSSLSIVQQALLAKQLKFKKLAIIQSIAALTGSAVAIALAAAGAGVFSLVAQSISASGISTVVLWLSSSWRPTRDFSLDDLRSIWRFSANVVGFNVVNYLARNVDYILIGRYLGAQSLGYYTLAYNLLLFPLQNLTYVVNRVTFPAYASIQDDNARLANAYMRVVRATATLSFPIMLGLLATCDVFVRTVYGERWSPAIPIVAILAPVGLFQSFVALNGSIYQSKGRADLQFRIGIIASTVVIGSFFIGLRWGILGIAAAYAVTTFCVLGYPLMVISLSLIDLRVRDFLNAIRRPFAASLCMLAGLGAIRLAFPDLVFGSGMALPLLVLVGVVLYFAATFAVNRSQLREMWLLVKPKPAAI
ncbi:MAG: MOP flippase family protein [Chloroflexota bacterium]|nr:MOP flippase family protein [Chloroflexota bacterium]